MRVVPKPTKILDRERRPIPGFEGLYAITKRGNLINLRGKSPKVMEYTWNRAISTKPNGQPIIQFQVAGQTVQMGIYKTIAEVWITPKERTKILAELRAAKRRREADPYRVVAEKYDTHPGTVIYLENQGRESVVA